MVSGAINSLWQRSKTVSNRINATKLRRAVVTTVREKAGHLCVETADLMGHHKTTVDKVYHIRKKEKNALLAAKELNDTMRNKFVRNNEKDELQISDSSRKKWNEKETAQIVELFAGMIQLFTLLQNKSQKDHDYISDAKVHPKRLCILNL